MIYRTTVELANKVWNYWSRNFYARLELADEEADADDSALLIQDGGGRRQKQQNWNGKIHIKFSLSNYCEKHIASFADSIIPSFLSHSQVQMDE